MPEINTDNMGRIAFHVPAPLLEEAREMCELEGWKFSEFHRMCWESGLAVQAEKSNKRLVNKGLRAKHQDSKKDLHIDKIKEIVLKTGHEVIDGFVSKKNPVISGDEPDQT